MNKNLRVYTRKRLGDKSIFDFLNKTSYTSLLIGLNIGFFIIIYILMLIFKSENVISFVALQPANFLAGKYLWTLLTSMFMHGSFFHIFANMISLFFIGSFVEKLIGRKRYTWFYLISGLFAGLFFVLLAYLFIDVHNLDMNVYAVGASGAIFALGGLLAVLTPNMRVYVFFFIPMRMWMGILFLLAGLWALSLSAGIPIGNTAHLGGLLVGLGYGFYLRKKYKRKTQIISKYFSS